MKCRLLNFHEKAAFSLKKTNFMGLEKLFSNGNVYDAYLPGTSKLCLISDASSSSENMNIHGTQQLLHLDL
jgi:hypothetical protein